MNKTKSFYIPKILIYEAYKKVKQNKGAPGIDEISIVKFEENLEDNLYKLWNRMSSGSYFPKPVKAVAILKDTRGQRMLCIPTISDRIAQTVGVVYLEPIVEPTFHSDSYGYRPNKSAINAIKTTRQRCWKYDWIVDLDIQGFFDNLNHDLILQAIKQYTDCKWLLLYIKRWIKAPIQLENGVKVEKNKGVPQGGSISPIIANIFMNLIFDKWMKLYHSTIPFERYVDDVIVHCKSYKQANFMKDMIKQRLDKFKLKLHPEKTSIVYCKDEKRKEKFSNYSFDFLGYTFRPRKAMNKNGQYFLAFLPAISNNAKKRINSNIRLWKIHRMTNATLEEISMKINPIVRGWVQYYGNFYKSAMYHSLNNIERYLSKWVRAKYKNFRNKVKHSWKFLSRIKKRCPNIFYHWTILRGIY